jgi:hypothetical protein
MKPPLIGLVVVFGSALGYAIVLVPHMGADALRAIIVLSLLNGTLSTLLAVNIAWALELLFPALRRR